jgi:nucleotide sugar dehydrogenase
MNVAVIGAGKMGLPLACALASGGARVVACDVKPALVDAINAGACPVDEPGLPELTARLVKDGHLRATTETAGAVSQSDVVVVIVPTLLTQDKDADTSIMEAVSAQIAEGLKPGMMVSYETTLPLGGTRGLLPILESRGLKGGKDFNLVFSPERVKSRRVLERLTVNPKVVGGLTSACAERGAAFYRQYLGAPVLNVGSLEAAEMVKLAGMVYRDVNIALANELARYCEAVGVDFRVVVQAANTDGEARLLEPGIGVGGHCTPVYPYFLVKSAQRLGVRVDMVELGRRINDEQPAHTLDRLERAWGALRGRRVLILGLGFRPQVKEHTCSPAFRLRDELLSRGADVRLHDPLYSPEEIKGHGFAPGSLESAPPAQALVLNTAHRAYADLDFGDLAAGGLQAVVDGRNLWQPEKVRAAGLIYVGVGKP